MSSTFPDGKWSSLWQTLPFELYCTVVQQGVEKGYFSLSHPAVAAGGSATFRIAKPILQKKICEDGERRFAEIFDRVSKWVIEKHPEFQDAIEKKECLARFGWCLSACDTVHESHYFVRFRTSLAVLKALTFQIEEEEVRSFPMTPSQQAWFEQVVNSGVYKKRDVQRLIRHTDIKSSGTREPIEFCRKALNIVQSILPICQEGF